MTDSNAIATAAMKTLERKGIPIFSSPDRPGLYIGPTVPELTFNQLIELACRYDVAFDPGRIMRTQPRTSDEQVGVCR